MPAIVTFSLTADSLGGISVASLDVNGFVGAHFACRANETRQGTEPTEDVDEDLDLARHRSSSLQRRIHAVAATDREKLQGRVKQVAPPNDGSRGKALCACVPSGSPTFDNRVGFIRQVVINNQVHVTCRGDTYDAGGAVIGGIGCSDFYPLVK